MRVDPVSWWRARSLNERVVAAVLAGSALLLAEVRFEHREVLGETWRAWVPLGYGASLLLVGSVALLRWRRGGRRVLTALFTLALAVGALGIWFHSGGHPLTHLARVLSAWRLPPGQDGGTKIGSAPPVLAPGAFWGLGLIGLIACLEHANDFGAPKSVAPPSPD
ncbi:MAG TPA: hypothetical protein VF994_16780 [Myxococcales bacterium]